jgi:hypothetical protein
MLKYISLKVAVKILEQIKLFNPVALSFIVSVAPLMLKRLT